MNAQSAVAQWRTDLARLGNIARSRGEKAYLKSDLDFLGVGVPGVRSYAKACLRANVDLSASNLRALCAAAWPTRVHELRSVAIALLELCTDRLDASDLRWIGDFIARSNTWAHVDWLGVEVVGAIVAEQPHAAMRVLVRWARDERMWLRRAAILGQMRALKEHVTDFEQFAGIAAPMLDEREFFIRKAIGWVLREISKRDPRPVARFLRAHRARVADLTLREGAKYLPAADRRSLGMAR